MIVVLGRVSINTQMGYVETEGKKGHHISEMLINIRYLVYKISF
jgi:hypothetical protein